MNHLPVKVLEFFFSGGLTRAALLENVVSFADGLKFSLFFRSIVAGLGILKMVSVIVL
jgi:hypothetical protein